MEITKLLSVFIFGIIAAGAFAILFNVPKRVLLITAIGGGLGLIVRNIIVFNTPSLAFGSFIGAIVIGIWAAHWSHKYDTPGHVISIPAIIPMVPGVLAYRTLMGLWHFVYVEPQEQAQKLAETFSYGLQTFLILLGISLGIAIPNVIDRFLSEKGKNFPEARS